MTSGLHDDEIPIPDELARRLLDDQFPQWRDLALRRLPPVGTDNQLFRLGEELLVRLPRIGWAAEAPVCEARWLPQLAPHLPLAVPAPVALGEPAHGYPFAWTVVPWVPGETVTGTHLGDATDNVDWPRLATDVGRFLSALRDIDADDAPRKSEGSRGAPLADCDDWVREWTAKAGASVDGGAVLAAWEESLAAPPWPGDPVWLHADVHEGNLLVRDRHTVAVIDWGGLGAGDPAVELNSCWGFWPPEAVPAFRAALGLDAIDPGAWLRGRGWALQPSISAMVYYERTAPERSALSRRTVQQILDDARRSG